MGTCSHRVWLKKNTDVNSKVEPLSHKTSSILLRSTSVTTAVVLEQVEPNANLCY